MVRDSTIKVFDAQHYYCADPVALVHCIRLYKGSAVVVVRDIITIALCNLHRHKVFDAPTRTGGLLNSFLLHY